MKKLKLHDVNCGPRDNSYCGPAVISALTGMTTSQAAAVIRIVTGKRSIRSTTATEIFHALQALGITMKLDQQWVEKFGRSDIYPKTKRPTIAQWLKMSKSRRVAGTIFLVEAGRHWQLISGRRYVCGVIKEIVSVRDSRVKRRARVRKVYALDTMDSQIRRMFENLVGRNTEVDAFLQKTGAYKSVKNVKDPGAFLDKCEPLRRLFSTPEPRAIKSAYWESQFKDIFS